MLQWLRDHPFIVAIAAFCSGLVWLFVDWLVRPVVSLNIERWAEAMGADKILLQFANAETIGPFLSLYIAPVLEDVPAFLVGVAVCAALFGLQDFWAGRTGAQGQEDAHPAETRKNGSPDYFAWDELDKMHLWQAACLWANREPKEPIDGRAAIVLQKLRTAILHHQLEPLPNRSVTAAIATVRAIKGDEGVENIPAQLMVSRDALRRYAEHLNKRPLFLFPEMR